MQEPDIWAGMVEAIHGKKPLSLDDAKIKPAEHSGHGFLTLRDYGLIDPAAVELTYRGMPIKFVADLTSVEVIVK